MDDHSLPAPIEAILKAVERGDRAAFLAAFGPEGVVDDWGRTFRGAEEIGGWSDSEFIGKKVVLKVVGVQTQGDVTTLSAQVGGEGFNGPSHFSFEIAADRVSRMTIRE